MATISSSKHFARRRPKRVRKVGKYYSIVVWSPDNLWPRGRILKWSTILTTALDGYLVPGMLIEYRDNLYEVWGDQHHPQQLLLVINADTCVPDNFLQENS